MGCGKIRCDSADVYKHQGISDPRALQSGSSEKWLFFILLPDTVSLSSCTSLWSCSPPCYCWAFIVYRNCIKNPEILVRVSPCVQEIIVSQYYSGMAPADTPLLINLSACTLTITFTMAHRMESLPPPCKPVNHLLKLLQIKVFSFNAVKNKQQHLVLSWWLT